MKARRIGSIAMLGVLVVNGALPSATSASSGKELERVRGTVGYRASEGAPLRTVTGRLDLADDGWVVTETSAAALLRLEGSSEIELGEKTAVQVGALGTARSGGPNTIVVDRGALHMTIHAARVGSSYVFQTGTSQIAVREADAYVVAGPRGTQVFCAACAPGDLTIRTGTHVTTIVTGEAATILGASPAGAAIRVGANAAVHNPAVDQFAASRSALAANAAVVAADPTGAADGRSAPAGTGAAVATMAAAAAVAAGVAAAAAGSSHSSGGVSSSPPQAPTIVQFVTTTASPTPAPGPAQPPTAPAPLAPHATTPAAATPTPSPTPRARAAGPPPPSGARGTRP